MLLVILTVKKLLEGPEAEACNFNKKETLVQVFSCEFCEIFTNTFYTEHLWVAASTKKNCKKQIKKSLGLKKQ